MRQLLVRLGAVVGQDGVGEVVVLVDEHVQRNVVLAGEVEQLGELVGDAVRGQDALLRRFGEEIRVAFQRPPQLHVAIGLEAPFQSRQSVVDSGEVEAQHDIAMALRRRLAAEVGAGEDGVELVLPAPVVVVLQERQPAGLAEAARADEEDVTLVLEDVHEAGLVDVQPAIEADAAEVGLAVGNAGPGSVHRVRRHLGPGCMMARPGMRRHRRVRETGRPAGV